MIIEKGGFRIKRSRKIVILCHCLLNLNAKIRGIANYPEITKDLIQYLLDREIGIIQLPCPEFTLLGEARWGQSESQYATPYFRKHCRKIAMEMADQVEEYLRHNYQILGVIGIDGSPSCGVNSTCQGEWGGELSANPNLSETLSSIRMIDSPGVLIKELKSALKERTIDLPFLGFPEEAELNQDEKRVFFRRLKEFLE